MSSKGGGRSAEALSAFMVFLGPSNMMAYISMMAPRLKELRRVLKPSGSIYLHCDATASHYLKMLMDAIFGPTNFLNEIVWKRFNFHADARRFGRVTDRILFYSRSEAFTFNQLRVPFSDEYVKTKFTHEDGLGRFRLSDLNPPAGRGPVYEFNGVTKPWRITEDKMLKLDEQGRIYKDSKVAQLKRYLDELDGQAVHELWTDVDPINPRAKERLGYPTQKPIALLKRIIEASSNPGDLVLDPFCGCGTAVDAAQLLGRAWIGIDITHLAVNLIRHRLVDAYGAGTRGTFDVIGEPTSPEDAAQLAAEDPYQFQWWALGLVGARPAEEKKGADKGIDGKLFFLDEAAGGKTKQVIISVKAGHTGRAHVHELRGVIERESAEIGVLISMQAPTRPMREEAASAGFYHSEHWNKDYPRIQLLTVADLLGGARIEYPPGEMLTFKKASRASSGYETESLLDSDPSS